MQDPLDPLFDDIFPVETPGVPPDDPDYRPPEDDGDDADEGDTSDSTDD